MSRLTLNQLRSCKVSKHSIYFKDADGNYRKTYNTRMYFSGHRKFVLWDGMVCWLRRSYRGHYVVWTMEAPSCFAA